MTKYHFPNRLLLLLGLKRIESSPNERIFKYSVMNLQPANVKGNIFYQTLLILVLYISRSNYIMIFNRTRSLHDVSRANNNRFAVVVCFRLAFHASGMRIFFGNFRV